MPNYILWHNVKAIKPTKRGKQPRKRDTEKDAALSSEPMNPAILILLGDVSQYMLFLV